MAYARVALHDEIVVDECTEVIETVKIREYLATKSLSQCSVFWLKYRPARRLRDRVDHLQAETSHGQAGKLSMGLAASTHRG